MTNNMTELIENNRLPNMRLNNFNLGRYKGFMDIWKYNSNHNFYHLRSYKKTETELTELLHYLNEGFIILECPRVYKIIKMDNIQFFRNYYNIRLENPNDYGTYYDDRYITYFKIDETTQTEYINKLLKYNSVVLTGVDGKFYNNMGKEIEIIEEYSDEDSEVSEYSDEDSEVSEYSDEKERRQKYFKKMVEQYINNL